MNFPDVENLKTTSKIIALLDSVIEQEWEYRYYSYNSKWSDGEEMASMRDGSGNHYFILFSNNECYIKVIDTKVNNKSGIEKAVSKLDRNLQNKLNIFLKEPAFYVDEITDLYWNIDGKWNSIGPEISDALQILLNPVSAYNVHADEYFEIKIGKKIVQEIFDGRISKGAIEQINPEIDYNALKDDLDEIGLQIQD